MRTPKIEALHRMIDWLNSKSLLKLENIPKLGLDNSNLENNPWLSGFIEAVGNFYCGFKLNANNIAEELKSYIRISQKRFYNNNSNISDNSNFFIMDKIKEFLDIKKVTEIKRNKENFIDYLLKLEQVKKDLVKFLQIIYLFTHYLVLNTKIFFSPSLWSAKGPKVGVNLIK